MKRQESRVDFLSSQRVESGGESQISVFNDESLRETRVMVQESDIGVPFLFVNLGSRVGE